MTKYKIAYMPGDGIGNDVLEAARIVLNATSFDAEYIPLDIGFDVFKTEGDPLPERTVEGMKETDAALFGAITSRPTTDPEVIKTVDKFGIPYRSPIVRLRQIFDLYSNMRPTKAYIGNPLNYRDDIDLITFRENTEGLYTGIEFDSGKEFQQLRSLEKFSKFPHEKTAVSCRVFTEEGCRRILVTAFEYAKTFKYPTVTVIHKANVIRHTCGMFRRIALEVSKGYPEVEMWETNIDAMCMWLIKNPQDYGVMVTTNMFGDIISDLAAQLVGGLGFASSASTNGDIYGLFEPTHGSAPKYAGQYKVNPTAAFLSVKLMLEWLGAKGDHSGRVRTYDMGGSNTTLEVAEEVVKQIP
ncbi:MAG: isocitrate/isopropylmalate dehydrogenase family protein [Candidatus Hodarchaeales archaeon]|jgi:3-isopropylmalate dehydrogenase